ncbi:MAG TPA: ABC transporter permease [Cyclobacteriaceae bacterium]|nr:ABC transporter permease [Cyclobacteriaceae bacterium]
MIKNYLYVTLRSMMKNKLFIAINVFGMGVAIACCIVAYFVYEFDSGFNAMHTNGDHIYRVSSVRDFENQLTRYGTVPLPLGRAVQENITDVSRATRYNYSWSDLRHEEDVFRASMAYVDPAFFQMFTFEFLSGNPADLGDKTAVFISDELATRLFGSTDVVDRTLTQVVGEKLKEVRVAGVFKSQPQNSSFHYRESFMNFENFFDEFENVREDDWRENSTLYVTIDNPARVPAVLERLQDYVANNNQVREDFVVSEFVLDHFPEMAFKDRAEQTNTWTWDAPPVAAVPGSAMMGVFILLIACFNLTNTTIAISSRRLKEIGIRKVMGSVRGQLILQFIGETLVICFFSLLLGLFFAQLLADGWNMMWADMKILPHYLDNPTVLAFLAGVLIFSALAAGAYPAFYISKFQPVSILKGKLKFGSTNYFVKSLLGLQYAISLVAIVSALAFIQNAKYQKDYDLGFDVERAVIAWVNGQSEFDTYRNSLRQNPDIISMAGSASGIFSNRDRGTLKVGTKQLEADIIEVGDHYLTTMGLTLIEGRDFIEDSETDRRESVIITRRMADEFGWQKAVGKELVYQDSIKLYVVGVVGNVYTRGLWREMEPMMIRYVGPERYSQIVVSTSSEKLLALNEFMEARWKEVFPNRVYNGYMPASDVYQATTEVNVNLVRMYAFLGVIAMMLSATGLFTLVSLNIIRRMKEIGVRKVLGASVANIARIVNTEFIFILVVASVLGCVLGYYLTGMLMSTIWRYYLDTTVFALVSSVLLMFLISAAAIGYKVFSAATMNPVNTLRSE